MKYTTKYLTAHPFFEHQTFEQFCSELPAFYFRAEIPADVIDSFEVVKRLLVHSYYEYKFIDEAYSKALHTFEMAMNIRYRDFAVLTKPLVFNTLVHELTKLNLFDTDISVLLHVKDMRNHFSHPERHSFGGAVYWHRVQHISSLINEMYENINLRLERRKLASAFIDAQKENRLDGFLVMQTESEAQTLYDIKLLMVNNKLTRPAYFIAYAPLFDLTCRAKADIKVPQVLAIEASNPIFDNGKLTVIDINSGSKIIFDSTIPSILLPDLGKWRGQFDSIEWNFMYNHSMQFVYSSIIRPLWKQFQAMG